MGVLIVTGSSRGIGAEICRLAAARGWAVCVNYASSADEAEGVAAGIAGAGGSAIAVRADVSAPEDVESMFRKVDEQLGPVTGLAEMYVSDERFAAYFDKHGDGLSAYVAESIRANASA